MLTRQPLPLLSQTALAKVVENIGGNLKFPTASFPPTATLRYRPPAVNPISSQGRREHGYTVFRQCRMRMIGTFHVALDPNGNVVLDFDTGSS